MRSLFAELMGKVTGVCAGRGGSQHLHWRNFYSNGVQGGIVPVATGMAFAEKTRRSHTVTIAFLGDGTLGEGVIYESFNLASLWQIPILYVLEDNRIAQTTPVQAAVAGNILARFTAFGISGVELDTSDVLEIIPVAEKLLSQVRQLQSPRALVIHTHRFGPHSKGDDPRPAEMIQRLYKERDPLTIQAARLSKTTSQAIETEIHQEVSLAFQQAIEDPLPTFSPPNYPGDWNGIPGISKSN
jgi:TPP-dependent pyruvate/acetoin dehydrogenase alpha subunit